MVTAKTKDQANSPERRQQRQRGMRATKRADPPASPPVRVSASSQDADLIHYPPVPMPKSALGPGSGSGLGSGSTLDSEQRFKKFLSGTKSMRKRGAGRGAGGPLRQGVRRIQAKTQKRRARARDQLTSGSQLTSGLTSGTTGSYLTSGTTVPYSSASAQLALGPGTVYSGLGSMPTSYFDGTSSGAGGQTGSGGPDAQGQDGAPEHLGAGLAKGLHATFGVDLRARALERLERKKRERQMRLERREAREGEDPHVANPSAGARGWNKAKNAMAAMRKMRTLAKMKTLATVVEVEEPPKSASTVATETDTKTKVPAASKAGERRLDARKARANAKCRQMDSAALRQMEEGTSSAPPTGESNDSFESYDYASDDAGTPFGYSQLDSSQYQSYGGVAVFSSSYAWGGRKNLDEQYPDREDPNAICLNCCPCQVDPSLPGAADEKRRRWFNVELCFKLWVLAFFVLIVLTGLILAGFECWGNAEEDTKDAD